jgi:hypothetical protein
MNELISFMASRSADWVTLFAIRYMLYCGFAIFALWWIAKLLDR